MQKLRLKLVQRWRWLLIIILGVFLLGVIIFQLVYTNQILPGTTVVGQPLVTRKPTDFAVAVSQQLSRSSIKLIDGDFTYTLDLGEIVPPLVSGGSVQLPPYSTWQRLIPFSLWWQRHDVTSFRLERDNKQLEMILQEVAQQRNQAPVSASMSIQEGVVEILSAKQGRELDIEATLTRLSQQDFILGGESEATLVFKEVLPVWSDVDVARLKDRKSVV